jgi:hypothetical protein
MARSIALKFCAALGAALLLVVGGTTAASADQLAIDGDGVTPFANNGAVIVQPCTDKPVTFTVLLAALRQSGSAGQNFKNDASVTVAAGVATPGLSVAPLVDQTIQLPSNWESVDPSPPKPGTDLIAAQITLAPQAASGTGSVSFTFSGASTAPGGGVRTGATALAVTWSQPSKCILDGTAPVLSLPAAMTVEATSAGGAAVGYSATATDETSPAFPPVRCDRESGSVFPLGSTTVTCSARDDAGNVRTGMFNVLVRDTTAPIVGAMTGIRLEASGPQTIVSWTDPTASDAVSGLPAVSCSPGAGSGFSVGSTTVTCSATDSAGNTGASEFTVLISDTTSPSIVVPSDLTVQATSASGAIAEWEATAHDGVDGALTVDCDPASGSLFALGVTTVHCLAKDAAGNETAGSFEVDVVDTAAPVITATDPAPVEATGPSGTAVAFEVTAEDTVDANVGIDCAPPSGSTFPVGVTIVTCTAIDDAGNESEATVSVTVTDRTAPVIDVPETILAEATSADGAALDYAVTASDLVDGDVDVTCDPVSGSTFALGGSQVDCTAADAAGNTAAASFGVIVQDTTAPALTLPDRIVAEAADADGVAVSYTASATDLVDGARPVTCAPAPDSTFPLGETTVNCSTSDIRGNVASGSFQVEVLDTTPPALTLPAPIEEEAVAPEGNVVEFTASAADAVDGDRPVRCDPSTGSTFPVGSTEVTCTAQDSRGNRVTETFAVDIVDTTAPSLVLPSPITEEAGAAEGNDIAYIATATDIVDGDVAVSCAPPSGSTFPVSTTDVTCTATDTRGNTATGSFSVTVADTSAPLLDLPEAITAEATGSAGRVIDFEATASDLVDGARPVTCLPPSGSMFALGSTNVNCRAEDTRGNEATGSFDVTVVDTTAPTLDVPDDVIAEATGPDGAAVGFDTSASDLVDGSRPVVCLPRASSTFALGTTTVNCASADSRGNTAIDSFTVTVRDTTKPTLTLPTEPIAKEATGPNGAVVTFATTASDLVDGTVAVTCSQGSGSTFAIATTAVSCEATDAAGNTATGSFAVRVADTTAPAITWNGGPAQGTSYVFGSVPATGTCIATDLVDGSVPCAITGHSTTVGGHTATATAKDARDNTATESRTYSVASWRLTGFFQPVDMSGIWNSVKGGATVPLKFEVFAGATELTATTAVASFTQKQVSCQNGSTVDEIEVTTTGGTSLRYDPTAGQYIQNWQTPKNPGACFIVTMTTQDGSSLTANFKLK